MISMLKCGADQFAKKPTATLVKVVTPLLRRFGVSLAHEPDFLNLSDGSPPGNAGHRVADRTVYGNAVTKVEDVVHELAHLVLHHPQISIDDVPEEFCLMQFERALAETCLEKKHISTVIRWQENTSLYLQGKDLGQDKGYRRSWYWLGGIEAAQKMGVLDEGGRPTWAYPNWEDFDLQKELHKFHQFAIEAS